MKNPIPTNLRSEMFSLLPILLSFVASIYFFNNFPEQVPTHWSMSGEIDGWTSRPFAAFSMPIIILFLYLLFLLLPIIDPKKERYKQFSRAYKVFKNAIIFFLLALYFIVGFNALGYDISVAFWVPFLVGMLFVLMGNYMAKIKMNWFVGIKNPWTLSSEKVWDKTHRFGGKVFIISGLVIAFMNVLPSNWRLPVFIVTILMMTFGVFLYSYILFNKEKKQNERKN